MPIFLAQRNTMLKEQMESDACDAVLLANTYRQFQSVNVLLSRIRSIYTNWIRPRCLNTLRRGSVLDIGFGGGDILRKLAQWSQEDGIPLDFLGIEIDARAFDYVEKQSWPANISFRVADVQSLVDGNEQFDFVISNHLLHHLDAEALPNMLANSVALSRQLVIFIDIERRDLAYGLYALLTLLPTFRNSYIRPDGLASIRRSFTREELGSILPAGWRVQPIFPFRLALIHEHAAPS